MAELEKYKGLSDDQLNQLVESRRKMLADRHMFSDSGGDIELLFNEAVAELHRRRNHLTEFNGERVQVIREDPASPLHRQRVLEDPGSPHRFKAFLNIPEPDSSKNHTSSHCYVQLDKKFDARFPKLFREQACNDNGVNIYFRKQLSELQQAGFQLGALELEYTNTLIRNSLEEHFEECGRIIYARAEMNASNDVVAYIMFEFQSSVTKALEFHETMFDGSTLSVFALHKHRYRMGKGHTCKLAVKLLVHNGFAGMKERTVWRYSRKRPVISALVSDCIIPMFMDFLTYYPSMRIIAARHYSEYLYVCGFKFSNKAEAELMLTQRLQAYGVIKYTAAYYCENTHSSFAYIQFQEAESVGNAIYHLHGTIIDGHTWNMYFTHSHVYEDFCSAYKASEAVQFFGDNHSCDCCWLG